MAVWLSPLFPRTEKRGFYGYDIETVDNGITFLCAALYYSDTRKFFITDKSAVIALFSRVWFRKKIIIATNTAYDWGGTFVGMPEEMEFRLIMRGSRLLSAKSHVTDKGLKRNHDDFTHSCLLEFWDTLSFAAQSVEDIGKLLKYPKMDRPQCFGRVPINETEIQELITYNMRDAEISKKFLEYLSMYLKKINCPLRMTIAGSAMAYFRANHLHTNYIQASEADLLEQFESYYGGRTEVIERGEHFGLHYYDVNSLYPAVMAKNIFPDPNSMQKCRMDSTEKIELYEGYSMVELYCPPMHLPLLPFRTKEGKLIFPTGNFSGRYTHVELRKAVQLGYTIKKVIASTYYKKTVRPFLFMEFLFDERKKFKDMHNDEGDFMAFTLKLISNSTYGKFGQRFKQMDVFEPFNLTMQELNAITGSFERIGNYYRMKEDRAPSAFCVPIWASYVTAYARLHLFDLAIKYDAKYMDTDSIFCKKQVPIGEGLGDLKLEMTLKRATFVRPKFYVLDDGTTTYFKIKGVSMKMVVSFAGETKTKRDYADLRKLVLMPKIVFKRFRKLRESKRGGKTVNEVFDSLKELSINDEKRLWPALFPTKRSQKSKPIQL